RPRHEPAHLAAPKHQKRPRKTRQLAAARLPQPWVTEPWVKAAENATTSRCPPAPTLGDRTLGGPNPGWAEPWVGRTLGGPNPGWAEPWVGRTLGSGTRGRPNPGCGREWALDALRDTRRGASPRRTSMSAARPPLGDYCQ